MDRHFGSRRKWNFFKKNSYSSDSKTIKRLKRKKSKFPFTTKVIDLFFFSFYFQRPSFFIFFTNNNALLLPILKMLRLKTFSTAMTAFVANSWIRQLDELFRTKLKWKLNVITTFNSCKIWIWSLVNVLYWNKCSEGLLLLGDQTSANRDHFTYKKVDIISLSENYENVF